MLRLRSWMGWWLLLGEFMIYFLFLLSISPDLHCKKIAWLIRSSILCSDFAIKRIDEPFVLDSDDRNEWAL
jgi:hypothetical protein